MSVGVDRPLNLLSMGTMDFSNQYAAMIDFLSGGGAVSDTVLHIHGGMIVLLAVRVLSGRSLGTPWPLTAVVFAALFKEFADYLAYDRIKPDTWSDILNTVLWPCVLFLSLRLRRAKFPSPTTETASKQPPVRS